MFGLIKALRHGLSCSCEAAREVDRRKATLPLALEAGKITPERAANELGQMRSALAWLQLMQREQRRPQQGVLRLG